MKVTAEDLQGLVTRKGLAEQGIGRNALARMLRSGELENLRYGVYATSAVPAEVKDAVRSGVITCVTALAIHGVWVPFSNRVHCRATGPKTRKAARKCVLCRQWGNSSPTDEFTDDLAAALRHSVRCLDDDEIVVVFDSILNTHYERHRHPDAPRTCGEDCRNKTWIMDVLVAAPRRVLRLLERCDEESASGTETLVRLRLSRLNIKLRSQVWIDDVGRVDFLVGTRLIIEVDGREFHEDEDAFENDRDRDLTAASLGYLPIRLTYKQVMFRWDHVEERIMAIVRMGAHLRPVPVSAMASPTDENLGGL